MKNLRPIPIIYLLGVLLINGFSLSANAKDFQLSDLGNNLTPLGAIKGGNADGSIPAWEGGITTPPSNYKSGDHHPDPFAGEKPITIISSNNMAEYEAWLTPGQKAMLKQSYLLCVRRKQIP